LLIHHFLVTPHPTATPAQPRKSTTSSALQLTEMGSRSSAFFHSCQWKSFDQRLRPSALSAFVTGACIVPKRPKAPRKEK